MRDVISMKTNQKVMTLEKAFEDFISEKKVLKLSPATIEAYEYRFKDFTKFFPVENACSDVTPATIFKFIEFLQTRNPDIKVTTINTNLRHLRAFLYSFTVYPQAFRKAYRTASAAPKAKSIRWREVSGRKGAD